MACIQSVATTEERHVLPEMHDGLAQILDIKLGIANSEALTSKTKRRSVEEPASATAHHNGASRRARKHLEFADHAGSRGIISTLQQYCEELKCRQLSKVRGCNGEREPVVHCRGAINLHHS